MNSIRALNKGAWIGIGARYIIKEKNCIIYINAIRLMGLKAQKPASLEDGFCTLERV